MCPLCTTARSGVPWAQKGWEWERSTRLSVDRRVCPSPWVPRHEDTANSASRPPGAPTCFTISSRCPMLTTSTSGATLSIAAASSRRLGLRDDEAEERALDRRRRGPGSLAGPGGGSRAGAPRGLRRRRASRARRGRPRRSPQSAMPGGVGPAAAERGQHAEERRAGRDCYRTCDLSKKPAMPHMVTPSAHRDGWRPGIGGRWRPTGPAASARGAGGRSGGGASAPRGPRSARGGRARSPPGRGRPPRSAPWRGMR